ncbi:hypothetical protein CMI46_02995 [Candidatus Pacearchaeota archaeon]|nr:hypothetical protein [Candidatus Pacearchaeota archaeon]|tara:strand:- start:7158 stop:8279 length:1122 start_codon:yes stop_codon:yes gene_type:complete
MERKTIIWMIIFFSITILIIFSSLIFSFFIKNQCGNGKIERGETSETCCLDTGCYGEQKCIDNSCEEPLNHTCRNSECLSGYECKNNSCQPKPLIPNIEIKNNLIILKNKEDVVYTYDECKLPGKIAISEHKVTQHLYEELDDVFDYIIIASNFQACRNVQNTNVRNGIEGIGMSLFDRSKPYGSNNSLKGIAKIGDISYPVREYILLHEFGHNWGIFIKSDLKNDLRHWDGLANLGVCTPMSASGNNFTYEDGKYSLTPCDDFIYSNLTLYLMGLISKEEISNEKFYLMKRVGFNYIIKNTYNINDIIRENGERIPNSKTSLKDFKVAFVLVTNKSGASISEIEKSQEIMEDYKKLFYKATRNKATIDFSMN